MTLEQVRRLALASHFTQKHNVTRYDSDMQHTALARLHQIGSSLFFVCVIYSGKMMISHCLISAREA